MGRRSPAKYDITGTGAQRVCLFLCASMFMHGHAVATGRHKVTPARLGNSIAEG